MIMHDNSPRPAFIESPNRTALLRCARASTIAEFALAAPVFLVLLAGTIDVGQMVYGQAVLNGAVQEAARLSSLENADTTAADAFVRNTVKRVLPGVTISTSRSSYFDFTDIGRPERWNDLDGNGSCDNSESYTDENGNGNWDSDIGTQGNGGSGDVVVYTVSANYKPVIKFPVGSKDWGMTLISSSTVKKNQPFATQQNYATTAKTCN